jgi:opacity protein-like surface antigen
MTHQKTKLALGIAAASLSMAGAIVSPQAMAGSKAQHHAEVHAVQTKVDYLEAQLQAMQAELSSLKAASSQASQSSADSEKVQELDQWMTSMKSAPAPKIVHDNMIFFRGGYARNDSKRDDLLTGNQFAGNVLGGGLTNRDAWLIGAGFDFGLTDDVWGLADNTEVDAELMFEYKNFGTKHLINSAAAAALQSNPGTDVNSLCALIDLAAIGGQPVLGPGNAGKASCNTVTTTQITISAAPKIKFMKGSAFRPWIIPAGLAIHVISPPSNGVTYITPGIMFAGGAEYAIWKDIKIGADARYHLTGTDTDGVKVDGFTAGGYLGIGF